MILTLIISGWLICGALAGSLCIGDFARDAYPIPIGLVSNLVMMGPLGLLVAFCASDRPLQWGWRLR